jgi:hypothetical protein
VSSENGGHYKVMEKRAKKNLKQIFKYLPDDIWQTVRDYHPYSNTYTGLYAFVYERYKRQFEENRVILWPDKLKNYYITIKIHEHYGGCCCEAYKKLIRADKEGKIKILSW